MPYLFPVVLTVLAAAMLAFAPPRALEEPRFTVPLEAPAVRAVVLEADASGGEKGGAAAAVPETDGASAAEAPPPGMVLMPVEGLRVADVWPSFGDPRDGGSRSHAGLDLMAPRGTPVRPAAPGTVRRAGESTNGGISVTIVGDDGRRYFYAHLDSLAPGLERGARVEVDTVIGYVGNTGNAAATAPHLHFEVALPAEGGDWSWTPVDPLPLLVDRSPAYP